MTKAPREDDPMDVTRPDEFTEPFQAMKAQMTPSSQTLSHLKNAVDSVSPMNGLPHSDATTTATTTPLRTTDSPITVPRADRRPTTASRPARPGAKKRRHHLAGVFAGGVLAVGLAGSMLLTGLPHALSGGTPEVRWPDPVVYSGPTSHANAPAAGQASAPANPGSYADLYAAITATAATSGMAMEAAGDTTFDVGSVSTASGTVQDSTSAGHSTTNTQVAGIDEGDIVKTDGSYLYIAHQRQVAIVAATGADSHRVAVIDTSSLAGADDLLTGPVIDLIIDGTTLIALTHSFAVDDTWSRDAGAWLSLGAKGLKAAFYDIADPTSPALLGVVEQSGAYVDSRLSNGVLYLISSYMVDSGKVDPNAPETFVPVVGGSGGAIPLSAEDCYILPYPTTPTYSVATAINVSTHEATSQVAVLGRADTIYMSPDNLYLASSDWNWSTQEQTEQGNWTIPGKNTPYTGASTDLVRIPLTSGDLSVAASARLPGTILNQFALDEYESHLRIVTTWTDESSDNWTQVPALWVVDAGLGLVGSIPELVRDEMVQSVRFDGSVGYVVTYEQVDPLFTVDLSDPARPTVQSALKIPGFSTYLHPFGEGRLLGVGQDTTAPDADGKMTQNGLKLAMFDISDPFHVTELATTPIPEQNTEVSQDHKAAFVDVERGLIGLPAVTWTYPEQTPDATPTTPLTPTITWKYLMYSWDGSSFTQRASVDILGQDLGRTADAGSSPTRGVQIGDNFYIITDSAIGAYTLADFAHLTTVSLS